MFAGATSTSTLTSFNLFVFFKGLSSYFVLLGCSSFLSVRVLNLKQFYSKRSDYIMLT